MTKIKITALLILLLFSVNVFSDAPSNYYDTAEGLTGTSLKSALHNIIDGHTDFGYPNARTQIFQTIHVRANYTYCIYSGRRADKTGYPTNEDINCEHLWPQANGCETSPMRSDMHHLMPSDYGLNSDRGNFPFGWVSAGTTFQNINDGLYEDDWVGTSETTITTGWCEPRDEVKGDIARALFYMDVRYNGVVYDNGWRVMVHEQHEDGSFSDHYMVDSGYGIQRYINACAGRGEFPIKFNGSIFVPNILEAD